MKPRHYLIVALIAIVAAWFAPTIDPASILQRLPLETVLRAQAPGYVGWNNVHMVYNNADFTDTNASGAQNIPRLSFYLPASQGNAFHIECDLYYSQATQVADNFGIQFSNSPTNAEFGGLMFTNATTIAAGPAANITNTAATNITTGTPAVATVLNAKIWGIAEQASNATDTLVNINVTQATAADVIVVKRGSACVYHSMN